MTTKPSKERIQMFTNKKGLKEMKMITTTALFLFLIIVSLLISDIVCASTKVTHDIAQEFRDKWPWHIQTIVYSFTDNNGNVDILVSEPPPFIAPESKELDLVSSMLPSPVKINWHRTKRGMNGWIQDLKLSSKIQECRVSTSDPCVEKLEEIIADLSSAIFGTSYKAHAINLNDLPEFNGFSAPKNLQIDSGGFLNLLSSKQELVFSTWDGEPVGKYADIMESSNNGTFYSTSPGLVVFAFDSENMDDSLRGEFRKFALDSDILLGGGSSKLGDRIVLLGRERSTNLLAVPPLRFEDLTLATSLRNKGQFQTFGTANFQGARVCHGKYAGYDVFPAFLSTGLADTRYGSTLNSADVLIKSYTESGHLKVPGLDLPLPETFPFHESEVFIASGGFLTYNWSLDRGIQVLEAPSARFIMSDHSNSLSVSYFADIGPDLSEYEQKSQQYFENLRSLPVFEARQLTTLLAVLQNRKARSELEDEATAQRTSEVAKAVISAAYRTIRQVPNLGDYINEGTARSLESFSERDANLAKALWGESVSKEEFISETQQVNKLFGESISSFAEMVKMPLDKTLDSLSAWHLESLDRPDGPAQGFTEYLGNNPTSSLGYFEKRLIDSRANDIKSSLLESCLIGDIEVVLSGSVPVIEGNIKTTDYVLASQDVITLGGHNLHREELLFQPTRSSKLTVRLDKETGQYIVDVPEKLMTKLDMPHVVNDLKKRDLRYITDPVELAAPVRPAPSLAKLTARSSAAKTHVGADMQHLPSKSLFSGYGWKSQVGRLSEGEFERQLKIAESRGFDLIVKSIGGDYVIYRKAPPGQFLIANQKALYATLSEWASPKSNIFFVNVPKVKIDAILKNVPSNAPSGIRITELEPLTGGGGYGNIVNRSVSISPPGRDPLRIITYEKSGESFSGKLISAFLGRRPDWSKAQVEQVTSSADEAMVKIGNDIYFELGWNVRIPEGRAEASYFKSTRIKLQQVASFVVKAFAKKKWTHEADTAGNKILTDIVKKVGDEYRAGGSLTTEEVISLVRDEMRAGLKTEGESLDSKYIRFLIEELEAIIEIGSIKMENGKSAS